MFAKSANVKQQIQIKQTTLEVIITANITYGHIKNNKNKSIN